MEDFITFDPGVAPDFAANKIRSLKAANTLLVLGLVTLICFTGYYTYMYYHAKEV